MSQAAIAELKAKLSGFLRAVKNGEEIVVTEHGKPIAKIVPFPREQTFDEELLDLERQGLIRLGTGKLPEGFLDWPRPEDPDSLVRAALDEDREETL